MNTSITREHHVSTWLPVGRIGNWEVRRRGCEPGVTELVEHVDGVAIGWMDDSEMEWEAHREIREKARGHVLITGLGLAMLPVWLARLLEVKSITVIEKEADILQLVSFELPFSVLDPAGKILIVSADATEFRPGFGVRPFFDVAWHDFTRDPMTKEQRDKVTEHYAPFCHEQYFWKGTGDPVLPS